MTNTPSNESNPPKNLEEALSRLEAIVREMDNEDINLEESISLFQEGMELTQFCQTQIAEAEQKIQKLTEEADGTLILTEESEE